MRIVLASVAIVIGTALGLYGWIAIKDQPHPSRRYITGMYASPQQRKLMDYVDPVTSEGLHEVRWDHMPRTIYATTVSTVSSSTAQWIAIPCCQNAYSTAVMTFR